VRLLFAAIVAATQALATSSVRRPPLFSSYDILEVTLQAPFEDLFSASADDEDYAVAGRLQFVDAAGLPRTIDDLRVSTRGHSSRRPSECDFPKLKLDFGARSSLEGSPFEGLAAVKIGTHCSERPDDALTPRYGRLASEKAAHREAFVYRLLEAMEVPSLHARPARITYVFAAQGTPARRLTRNALFVEDDVEAMKRLGATRAIAPERFESASTTFTPSDTARVAFAEAMIGNFDWCLRMTRGDTYRCNDTSPLWNVLAPVDTDGRAFPVIYDFDLAGMVVARHVWFDKVFNPAFAPSETEIEVVSQVQRTRSLFVRLELDRTRNAFVSRKAKAYTALEASVLDEGGRAAARRYLDSFFAAIETDEAFYRPVVTNPDARMYLDAGRTRPACDSGVVPPGTPVSVPVGAAGEMVRVLILDALWQWTDERRCDVVRSQPVWIASHALGTEYPK
jgi:hypothetical protein